MSGPWEKYKTAPTEAPSGGKPWEKYGRSPSQFPVSTLGPDSGAINEGQPVASQEKPMGDFADRAMTQLESFGNTVSMGYLPQIQAAFEKINPDPSGGLDDQLRAQGFTVPGQDYVDLRDENISRQQAQGERNPYDSAAGMIAGVATQAPMIASAAVKMGAGAIPGIAARTKDAVATGFGLGAIANPGDIQGKVSLLQGAERLKNASTSGALGAAGQGVGEGVAKVGNAVKNAPAVLDTVSKVKAFKSVGAMLKDFRAARGNNSPEAIGETLIKKNIVAAGDSLEDMAEKLTLSKQETGQTIRGVYQKVNDFIKTNVAGVNGKPFTSREQRLLSATKLNGKKIADDSRTVIMDAFKNNPGNTDAKSKVLSVLDDVAAMGDDVDIQDMIEARVNIDTQINYSKKMQELPIVQQQLKTVRDNLHKAIQQRVRAVGAVVKDKELIGQLRTANKEYGHLATAESIAKDKVSRESANRFFSLGDRMTSGAGATIGAASGDTPEERIKNGLVGFATGAVAAKYGRYSLPMVSRASKKLGESLKAPAAFAKYGEPLIEAAKRSPQEFQALINQFGKDPEFTKMATIGSK